MWHETGTAAEDKAARTWLQRSQGLLSCWRPGVSTISISSIARAATCLVGKFSMGGPGRSPHGVVRSWWSVPLAGQATKVRCSDRVSIVECDA
jgi:hypothetical protein